MTCYEKWKNGSVLKNGRTDHKWCIYEFKKYKYSFFMHSIYLLLIQDDIGSNALIHPFVKLCSIGFIKTASQQWLPTRVSLTITDDINEHVIHFV